MLTYSWPWRSFWISYKADPHNVQPQEYTWLDASAVKKQPSWLAVPAAQSVHLPNKNALVPWPQRIHHVLISLSASVRLWATLNLCWISSSQKMSQKKLRKIRGHHRGIGLENKEDTEEILSSKKKKECKFLWEKESHKFINKKLALVWV